MTSSPATPQKKSSWKLKEGYDRNGYGGCKKCADIFPCATMHPVSCSVDFEDGTPPVALSVFSYYCDECMEALLKETTSK